MDPNIIYAAAAYHDSGLVEGRDVHHMASGRQGPRTIYGSILAEADRVIDTETITSSFIGYLPSNNPKMSIIVTSPNSSHPNSGIDYASLVTLRITKDVTNKYNEYSRIKWN